MKPKTIVFDIDGTLCDNAHHVAFLNEGQFESNPLADFRFAPVNQWCLDMVYGYHDVGYKIIFLTARRGNKADRELLEEWLVRNITKPIQYELLMRKEGDQRNDYLVKLEAYNLDIYPHYNVVLAIDDKQSICDMWRSLGITALHCNSY